MSNLFIGVDVGMLDAKPVRKNFPQPVWDAWKKEKSGNLTKTVAFDGKRWHWYVSMSPGVNQGYWLAWDGVRPVYREIPIHHWASDKVTGVWVMVEDSFMARNVKVVKGLSFAAGHITEVFMTYARNLLIRNAHYGLVSSSRWQSVADFRGYKTRFQLVGVVGEDATAALGMWLYTMTSAEKPVDKAWLERTLEGKL